MLSLLTILGIANPQGLGRSGSSSPPSKSLMTRLIPFGPGTSENHYLDIIISSMRGTVD